MGSGRKGARRCILGVFAHPDDETSAAAGTFTRYAREGVDIYVVTATGGEQGTLGKHGLAIKREDLPAVREAELRSVLELYGAHSPILLGYRDQQLAIADFDALVARVVSAMEEVNPDVVITFGPTGVSGHEDHIAIHRATVEAHLRYRNAHQIESRLFYVAIPREVAEQFELHVHESELTPTVICDIKEQVPLKIQGLRAYRSQEDAQQLADMYATRPFDIEGFHQAHPQPADSGIAAGFWDD